MEEGRGDGEITARRSDTRRMRGIFSLRGHAHPSFYAAFFTIVRLFNPPLCHVSAPFDSHRTNSGKLLSLGEKRRILFSEKVNGKFPLFVESGPVFFHSEKENREQKILMNNNGIESGIFINPDQIYVQDLFRKNQILLMIYMH